MALFSTETELLKKKKKPNYFGDDTITAGGLFSGLPTGEEEDETQALVGKNLQGMLIGSAYDPSRTQQRETLQRAATNLRAQTGGKIAEGGFLGQGTANKSQQETEQTIFQGLADTEMGMDVEEQAMKERGLGLATDIGKEQQSIVTQRRGQDIGLTQSREALTSQEKIAERGYGIDEAKLSETARQFNISRDDAVKHAENLLEETKRQFNEQLAVDKGIAERNLEIQQQNVDLSRAGLQGFYDPYTGAYVKGSGQLAESEMDLKSDSMYGYTGPNGWVDGSITLAAKSLGLQADTVDMQKKELFGYTDDKGVYHSGKYDLLSAADKREADRLYGYTDAATGTKHMGEMEISEKVLGIQTAADTRAEESMYGYTDRVTGEWVKGTAQISSDMLGLESERYEDQKKELYGYTDPKTGQVIKGKYELLNDAEKRAADDLYGYDYLDSKGVTQHVSGTLELQNKASEITEQGLKIEEAKTYGYFDKEYVDPVTGVKGKWVNGTLENEAERLGLDISDFQLRRDQLYGYDEKDALGNVTNHVKGALEIAADTFGLQEKTVDAQITEMFGGKVDSDGDGVPDKTVIGKYDLLSEEQKRAADEMYGYNDPKTGEYVPGKMKFDQEMSRLSVKLTEAGIAASFLTNFGEDIPEEAYVGVVNDLALMVGLEHPAMLNGEPVLTADGEPVMIPGLDIGTDPNVASGEKYSGWTPGTTVKGQAQYDALKGRMATLAKNGDAITDNGVESMNIAEWTTSGANRWAGTKEASAWVAKNVGLPYQASNGRIYEVVGYYNPGGKFTAGEKNRGTKAAIIFRDIQTGVEVKLTRGTSFPDSGV